MSQQPADQLTADQKKQDKKARRAAKVQKKVDSGELQDPTTYTKDKVVSKAGDKPTSPPVNPASSKTPKTKAERRALQEAQRKAKEEQKQQPGKEKEPIQAQVDGKENGQMKRPPKVPKEKKEKPDKPVSRADFFSHLPLVHKHSIPQVKSAVHPIIKQLGIQYANGIICGSNARAIALLCALKQVVNDYETPSKMEFAQGLLDTINHSVDFINKCRPMSVSMDSVIKYLKPLIQSYRMEEACKVKHHLDEALERFYHERIFSSDEHIVKKTVDSLCDGDVLITFGHSSLILKVLIKAHKELKNLSVIVVDSRPKFEGKEMLRKLVKSHTEISCTYVLINSLSYVMPRATKVLLGAHAVLANGYIMSRLGSSQVALMAKAYNKPVLVCCETYKFSDKMRTDSIVYNELGDSDEILKNEGEGTTNKSEFLKARNIIYDMTPPDYITGLITESGMIPCTSAPVVIRVKQQYDFVDVKL